jgi:hypothetical protein
VILLVGFIVEMKPLMTQSRPKPASLAARICLWAGTLGLWGAQWVSWTSRQSVVFERPLGESDFLGVWVAGVFTVISGWRGASGRRANALLALVWFAGLCVTALHVKELLFQSQ